MPHAIRLRAWLWRILTWDGIVPLLIWSAPVFVKTMLPNQRGPLELTAIVLPVAAFLARGCFGYACIQGNACSKRMRELQVLALGVGIFFLFVMDALLILLHLMPPQSSFLPVFVVLYALYLPTMLVAMYPGSAVASVAPAIRD